MRPSGMKQVSNLAFKDAGKAFLGSAIAVVLALFLPMFVTPVAQDATDDVSAIEESVEP